MKYRSLSLLILIVVVFSVFFYFINTSFSNKAGIKAPVKLTIATTFYPLADFAQKIGGDKVQVINLTPPGTEPHDYEPTPKDISEVYNSKLLVYLGIGLDSWVEKILPDLTVRSITILKASDGVSLLGQDPHIWLDPVLAQQIALNLKNELIKIDPQNASYYSQNSDRLIVQLIEIDNLYRTSLNNCSQDTVVSSHNVLGYLANRYHFKNIAISGLNPDEEPSSQKMADIARLISSQKVKYLLTEPLVSPKLADTLAKETQTKIMILNPLEGLTQNEIASGLDYVTVQKTNITTLQTALECRTK